MRKESQVLVCAAFLLLWLPATAMEKGAADAEARFHLLLRAKACEAVMSILLVEGRVGNRFYLSGELDPADFKRLVSRSSASIVGGAGYPRVEAPRLIKKKIGGGLPPASSAVFRISVVIAPNDSTEYEVGVSGSAGGEYLDIDYMSIPSMTVGNEVHHRAVASLSRPSSDPPAKDRLAIRACESVLSLILVEDDQLKALYKKPELDAADFSDFCSSFRVTMSPGDSFPLLNYCSFQEEIHAPWGTGGAYKISVRIKNNSLVIYLVIMQMLDDGQFRLVSIAPCAIT